MESVSIIGPAPSPARFPMLVASVEGPTMARADAYLGQTLRTAARLTERRLDDLDTLIVTKPAAGFDAATVEAIRLTLREAAAGKLGRLKFLVFDFAHDGEASGAKAEGFNALVDELSNLILTVPVVSVAYARGDLAETDLEFALACSMLVSDPGVRFSMDADPVISIGAYGLLALKIGFVRAERLMEEGGHLDAARMHELLLVKHVVESGIEDLLRHTARRHNSHYGIYRAQRINSRSVHASLRG